MNYTRKVCCSRNLWESLKSHSFYYRKLNDLPVGFSDPETSRWAFKHQTWGKMWRVWEQSWTWVFEMWATHTDPVHCKTWIVYLFTTTSSQNSIKHINRASWSAQQIRNVWVLQNWILKNTFCSSCLNYSISLLSVLSEDNLTAQKGAASHCTVRR